MFNAHAARASDAPSRRRRWLFRLLAAMLVPALLLGAAELGLRLAGYGRPTSFFVPVPEREHLTTNPEFGRRFFPAHLAREPVLDLLPAAKPAGTIRVFLLGGSAAMGTPDATFGVARVLEFVLAERYPGTDFDVVNTAMAAINSHVVREIAREVARREPDLVIVYLGNNEVVGPFGAGSVFGRYTPALALVRGNLAVKRLRLGQLLAASLERPGEAPATWRGMEMFVGREVAADDPRLESVYRHFADNLTDIVELGRSGGAETLLATVAVNLLDSPPFASRNRPDLAAEELERWRELYERGVAAARAGELRTAAEAFAAAAAIDDRHAELRYRQGVVAASAGDLSRARPHFAAARDLDALRFRADARINETIRRVAEKTGAPLVDAERGLGESAAVRGLPGGDLFWEHVHLTFAGNVRLAELLAEAAAEPLAETSGLRPTAPPPSPEAIAAGLGLTDRETLGMAKAILAMTGRAPFTGQVGHAQRLGERRAAVRALAVRSRSAGRPSRLAEPPATDLPRRERWARRAARRGDLATAVEGWRGLLAALPGVARWEVELAFALAESGEREEGAAAIERALVLDPDGAETLVNAGVFHQRHGDAATAESLLRQALAADPASEGALLNLGFLLEERAESEAANELYRKAVELHPGSPASHRRLGEFLDRGGRLRQAVERYREALALDPDQPPTLNNLGFAVERLGSADLAEAAYREALALDPGSALAWFNLADLLLATGRGGEAADAYRSGLALDAGNAQARENLAVAERSR